MSGTIAWMILIHLASVLIVTALWKLVRLHLFVQLVVDYAVMPPFLSRVVGTMIPFAELFTAVLILHEGTFRYGMILLMILLASFAWAVSRVIKEKRKLSCGCYGQGMEAEADHYTLVKIGYLFLHAVLIIGSTPVSGIVASAAFSIPAGLFLTALFILAQKVWSLHRKAVEGLREIR